jgi:phytoene dehydrogenase-like protein
LALADIHAIYTSMQSQASTHSGVPVAPRSVEGMLEFARLHPLTVRWTDKPFTALLDQHITGKAARHALISLAGYISHTPELLRVADMEPLFGYYIHGGCYPVGGSGRLAQALADSTALDGGEVHLETPVAQVLIEDGAPAGVRFASGETPRASALVMNADFLSAEKRLVDKSLWPQAFLSKIDATQPACSAFGIHLGVRGDFAGVPPVIHIRAGVDGVGIVIPSAVDQTAAPAGYSTVEVMCQLDADEARAWFEDEQRTNNETQRSSLAYVAKKQAAGERLLVSETR